MRLFNKMVSLLVVLTLILPVIAEAKAGARVGGGSYRSSGGFGGYRSSGSSNYRPQTNYRTYPSNTAVYQRPATSSFFSGLFSGLFGAWLYHKMFNSPAYPPATNTSSNQPSNTVSNNPQTAQQQGGFFRTILLLGAAYLVWRLIRNRRRNRDDRYNKNMPGPNNGVPRKMNIRDFMNLSKAPLRQNIPTLSQDDQNAFENLLVQIQNAWSQSNTQGLQRLTTPEMFENFSEIIRDNQQQNITNHITQVKLLKQEMVDGWQEGNNTFARIAFTWSALDYTVNNNLPESDPGYLLDGSKNEPTIATEIWTLEKSNNGNWLLAEIQPV